MNFYFGKKLYGNGFIGIEPSLLFRGRFFYYNGKEEVGKETLTIKKIDDFRYYFSGFAGFSIGYKIQNKYQPFTTIAYQRGFFPLQKNDEGLRGMNISVGLKYIMRN
ncbi:hypothetical protein FACS1894156_5270 [Bacteroidia bacterium]|nr:hypothetical protein FACS1894156_5270 [Bacteroidia bacterium]